MILVSLMAALALPAPQTSTAVFAVRARVVQTCEVAQAGVACHGALDRSASIRIIRSGSVTTFEF